MYDISMITGDGIGPELADSASAVIKTLDEKLGVKIALTKLAAGDAALKDTGYALPKETLDAIKNSDACLKAPVGESAADVIVVLRRKLDLYANLRPAKSIQELWHYEMICCKISSDSCLFGFMRKFRKSVCAYQMFSHLQALCVCHFIGSYSGIQMPRVCIFSKWHNCMVYSEMHARPNAFSPTIDLFGCTGIPKIFEIYREVS